MEIPADAKKCRYCSYFQNWLSHPGLLASLFVVPLLAMYLLMGISFQRTFDQGKDFQPYANQIDVSATCVRFGEGQCGPTVAVLGQMANDSDVDWKEVRFHVEFRDAEGRLTDAGQAMEYSYYVPAHQKAAFKVSFPREFPEASYASHTVRVVDAKDGAARW